jgi:hypothetical protein
MEYVVEAYFPRYTETAVMDRELPEAYANLKSGQSASVTWNSGGETVLIVAVGDDYSVISLLDDDTWYYLAPIDEPGEETIIMGGVDSTVPRKALAPRELGLTVLQRADDLPGLRTDYTWAEQ